MLCPNPHDHYKSGKNSAAVFKPDKPWRYTARVKKRRIKPRFYLFLGILVFFLFVAPYLRVRSIQMRQRQEIVKLKQEIELIETRIKGKKDKLIFMQTPQFIEREARKLGMTKKGETWYYLAEPYSEEEKKENQRRNPSELKDNNY